MNILIFMNLNLRVIRTTAHYLDPGDASQNPSDNDRSSPLKSLRSALKKHSKGSNSTNSAPEKTGASPGAGETPKNSWNTVNASAASNNTGYFNDVYVGVRACVENFVGFKHKKSSVFAKTDQSPFVFSSFWSVFVGSKRKKRRFSSVLKHRKRPLKPSKFEIQIFQLMENLKGYVKFF